MYDMLYLGIAFIIAFSIALYIYNKEHKGIDAKNLDVIDYLPALIGGLIWPATFVLGICLLATKAMLSLVVWTSEAWDKAKEEVESRKAAFEPDPPAPEAPGT